MIGVLEDVCVLDWRNFCISVGRPDLTTRIDEAYAADVSDTGGRPFGIEHETSLLGEHTDEVLASLGRSEAEIAELRECGVV